MLRQNQGIWDGRNSHSFYDCRCGQEKAHFLTQSFGGTMVRSRFGSQSFNW